MVKKYKNLDIAVVYKTANIKQLKRLKKYCPTYKHINEDIYCKVVIINYDVSIIDYIKEGKIYQVIHGDYENPAYKWKPPTHERITSYIGITKHICESFKRITGKENIILGYNPLTIESDKPLILISATRLSPIKGKERMIKFANALDKAKINYIWFIFTNDTKVIDNPNIVYMKPRLNLQGFIKTADYLVQLSDTEACSYAINEALYQNTAVITTKLPYLDEIGVKDGINSYLMEFNCSNISEIVKKIQNVPSFNFTHLKDSYSEILAKGKSNYKEEIEMKVRATNKYKELNVKDNELGRIPKTGEEWEVSKERYEVLAKVNKFGVAFVEAVEELKETAEKIKEVGVKAEDIQLTPKETKKKTTTRKKKV